jgi:hypothetical protein
MNLPQPPKKALKVGGFKLAKPVESGTEASSLLEDISEQMVMSVSRFEATAQMSVEMQTVHFFRGISVEIARPTLAAARRFDTMTLFESLLKVAQSVYVPLISTLTNSSEQHWFLGEKPKNQIIEYRVQVCMKIAEKLLQAQGWRFLAEAEAYQAPLYMGDGILFSVAEMEERFQAFIIQRLKDQKLLK